MAELEQAQQSIVVDGVAHELSKFSTEVHKLVSIHQAWDQKVAEARLSVAHTEAAVRDLSRELLAKIKTELEAAGETAEEATAEVETIAEEAAPAVEKAL